MSIGIDLSNAFSKTISSLRITPSGVILRPKRNKRFKRESCHYLPPVPSSARQSVPAL